MEDIITKLHMLTERFGMSIDWNSDDAVSYVQQLCHKYILYIIFTSVIYLLIGIGLLFIGKLMIIKTKYYGCLVKYGKNNDTIYNDVMEIICQTVAYVSIIIGIFMILLQVFNIITCIVFPEKIIIYELIHLTT